MHPTYIPDWLSGDLAKALAWTLIHSLWEGLIAAVIAGIIVNGTRHSRAGLRYNLLSALFSVFILVTGISFFIIYQSLEDNVSGALVNDLSFNSNVGSNTTSKTDLLTANISYLKQLVNFFNANTSLIVLTWLFFFFARCLKLLGGMWDLHKLRTTAVHQPAQRWLNKLIELKGKLNIGKNIRLLESRHVKVPMTIGHLKSTILLPIGLLANLPPDQVESILLHELAHIKRKDYIVNLMQGLAEAVLFFNPALLWISSLIRQEREACCDDIVVENLADEKIYLEALVSFNEYTMGTGNYAMGLTGRKNLLNRVKRLLTRENEKLNMMEKSTLVLCLIAVTAFSFITHDVNDPKQQATVAYKNLTGIEPEKGIKQYATYNQNTPDTTPVKKVSKTKKEQPDSRFTQVRFHNTNDPAERVHTYEITDKDANIFRITREEGQMTALSVNSRAIASAELANYQHLFKSAEQFLSERSAEKRAAVAARNGKAPGFHANPGSKSIGTKTNKLTEPQVENSGKKKSDFKQLNHLPSTKAEKKKAFIPDENWANNAARIHGVLNELVKAGVVANTSSVEWFGINDIKMMVNGKEVSETLHRRLKAAYGIEKNKGLFYGPSTMYGPGVYFDKKDLDLEHTTSPGTDL